MGERPVDCFTLAQTLLKLTIQFYRTDIKTLGTAGTLDFVNITSFFLNFGLEIADIARYLHYLAVAHEVNVRVLTGGGHLWGQDTGGTIQGGEGLIKLSHVPTDAWLLFHEIHLVTGISNLYGGLYSGNTTANDQGIGINRNLSCFQRLVV